jgi:hypothetical protein
MRCAMMLGQALVYGGDQQHLSPGRLVGQISRLEPRFFCAIQPVLRIMYLRWHGPPLSPPPSGIALRKKGRQLREVTPSPRGLPGAGLRQARTHNA